MAYPYDKIYRQALKLCLKDYLEILYNGQNMMISKKTNRLIPALHKAWKGRAKLPLFAEDMTGKSKKLNAKKALQVKDNLVKSQIGKDLLHIFKLKVVRRYIADMFKIIMVTNQGIKRNQNCAKAIWRNRETLLKAEKKRLEEMETHISFLDSQESVSLLVNL